MLYSALRSIPKSRWRVVVRRAQQPVVPSRSLQSATTTHEARFTTLQQAEQEWQQLWASSVDSAARQRKSHWILNRVKNSQLTPTLAMYDQLLSVYIANNQRSRIRPMLDDMDAYKIVAPMEFYHRALKLAAQSADTTLQARILDTMAKHGMEATSDTYEMRIRCAVENDAFEHALDLLEDMETKGLAPTASSVFLVLPMAIKYRQPQTAHDLWLKAREAAPTSPNLAKHAMAILRLAAMDDQVQLLQFYWPVVVQENKMMVDDGVGKMAILVAGRAGDAQLAYTILATLAEHGLPLVEHHFACLLDAFASTLDLHNTLRVFEAMRKAGVAVTKTTTTAVARRLGNDINAVRLARQALDDIYTQSGAVDIVAFNMVIHAFAYHGDFDNAMKTFDMRHALNLTPDVDTLDALLDACIHARNPDAGTAIFHDLTHTHHVHPAVSSLSKMVVLMCTNHDNYEAAFDYLEQIKQRGDVPFRGAYYRLVKKLAACNDARLPLAIEDMKACGYNVSTHLHEYIADKADINDRRRAKQAALGLTSASQPVTTG
ncbi:hypothetical protein BC940DRAFT_291747 [Gongronella butleri]|nr:hypothetical protein BC940DRAFT_291747 [Gongronella butleri]